MPGSFRLEPCPNCCTLAGCVYESDAFDRADSSSLGAKWTETAGDWSIASNTLAVSSASAKATCTTLHPTPTNKYIVSATVKFTTDGDVARVYVGDSAYYAELERITSSCGRMRLYDGATCKGSVGVSLSTWTRLVVCSEEDKVHVGTGGSPMLTIPATVTSSIVALGTAACAGTVSFEDFSLSKHYEDDATCPSCGSEGCTWFSDNGCASGSLSATDWTATGTWAYDSGMKCTANGAITVVPTQPLGAATAGATAVFPKPASGVSVKFYLDSASTTYIEVDGYSYSFYTVRVRFYSGGVKHGTTGYFTGSTITARWCWDGTTLTGTAGDGIYSHSQYIDATPASNSPKIDVSGLSGSQTITSLTAVKLHTDIGASSVCIACGTPDCLNCAPGTFHDSVSVTLAGLISKVYGCPCPDMTQTLYAVAGGCHWSTGWVDIGPCDSLLWKIDAEVVAVTGGYKLRITVVIQLDHPATTNGILFENTVLSGSPVDCTSVFDGDVPRVYGDEEPEFGCDFSAATCTFAA